MTHFLLFWTWFWPLRGYSGYASIVTNTLNAERQRTRQAIGMAQIRESNGAAKIRATSGEKKEKLEADLGHRVKFEVSKTLLQLLPGMEPHSKLGLLNL